MKVSIHFTGLLANGGRPELFINLALQLVTHPSLLFTDTVGKPGCAQVIALCQDFHRLYTEDSCRFVSISDVHRLQL